MKNISKQCIDCGSKAIETMVDEVKPVFRQEIISFECGATLMNIFSSNGNIGRVYHTGCNQLY